MGRNEFLAAERFETNLGQARSHYYRSIDNKHLSESCATNESQPTHQACARPLQFAARTPEVAARHRWSIGPDRPHRLSAVCRSSLP
jgi:hypothetical protein